LLAAKWSVRSSYSGAVVHIQTPSHSGVVVHIHEQVTAGEFKRAYCNGMVIASRLNLSDFPDSPYAAELQLSTPRMLFAPKLEAEYGRSHLLESRTLIRVACALALLLMAFRGMEQVLAASWHDTLLGYFWLVAASSAVLTWIAWSPAFERIYLPWAQIVVPVRNLIVAAHLAELAAHGQLEFLMVLPLLLIGPFFFLGLRFRAALVSGVLTVASYGTSALLFGLAVPVALRSCTFLLLALIACAVAARQKEKYSRTRYLENCLTAELAQRDALTGAKNRRVFDEHFTLLWQQALADRRTLAILLLDVDHFKAYNDRYGHQAGDQALRQVAQSVQSFIRRPRDVFARYGGEEFAAILYDVDGSQAKNIANQIRSAVEAQAIEHLGSGTSAAVTISVGVAVVKPTHERDSRGALQLADQALYEAKVKGRNRVKVMDESEYRSLVTGAFTKRVVGLPMRNLSPQRREQ
jgi:diguanylate cyclase (GGDEF)-like protein